MKILILGNETNRKVAALLSDGGIEVAQASTIPQALDKLVQKEFDVVLINSLLPKAEEACSMIKRASACPVALITNGHQLDWNKLNSVGVDGFIPETAPRTELIARLKAIVRSSNIIKR